MDALLEPLVNSPDLFRYVAELEAITRTERERRDRFYTEITSEQKWEFINGEVVMHSPATAKHSQIRGRIECLLRTFAASHAAGWAGGEKTLICCRRNDYEPDVLFFGPEKARGIAPDTLRFPPPDFAVEILSESTAHRDRGIKMRDYAAHAVTEYWIVDPVEEAIEQYFIGADGAYALHAKQVDGSMHSRAVAGWVMPVRGAFDDAENLAALRAMLAS